MLFNSLHFFVFFAIVLGCYFALPFKWRWVLLLAVSCYFYMFFIPVYILILLFTIIIDYYAGIWIENAQTPERRKTFLTLSIVANVGILAFFKYYNFLNENISAVLGLGNIENPIPYLHIILPIGLSFHTFQAMSYTMEVYYGNQKAEKHFGYYALYVMYFPQLVAGPIERPQNVLHQFHQKHNWDTSRVMHGLQLVVFGLFKKVAIADRCAIEVDKVFNNYQNLSSAELITGTVLYAFQIYCDFSGYSDIAIGSSRIMGIELTKNFNFPFFSTSITEYWRRWHISLTTWFNHYLFTPIVTKYRDWGKWGVVFGLMVVFFMSGLWHGAAWHFVMFGVFHGAVLSIEFLTKKSRKKLKERTNKIIHTAISSAITMSVVLLCFILFRSASLTQSFEFIGKIFEFKFTSFNFKTEDLIICFFLIAIVVTMDGIYNFYDKKINGFQQFMFFLVILLLTVLFGISGNEQFIYFQF
jgi:alginate O-acetyltransferase complex protein AlgI